MTGRRVLCKDMIRCLMQLPMALTILPFLRLRFDVIERNRRQARVIHHSDLASNIDNRFPRQNASEH